MGKIFLFPGPHIFFCLCPNPAGNSVDKLQSTSPPFLKKDNRGRRFKIFLLCCFPTSCGISEPFFLHLGNLVSLYRGPDQKVPGLGHLNGSHVG